MAAAAESVRRYSRFFHNSDVRTVLDYGAGTLRNTRFLAAQGFSVYAADIPEQIERIIRLASTMPLAGILEAGELGQASLDVDLVISTYVLNIIPEGTEKWRYLKNIELNIRPGGYLLIEVRCRRDDGSCGSTCAHHLTCPGCVKTYSHDELDRLVAAFGFRRLSHYYSKHALAVIYRKENA
ncbi:class I SAM-dependent methyltransferase [Geobacter pickeringii]|uniref:Uncharacterized protein n=1 Tax=Geobacter pickeringii TaxID=345632 RepID=A0A0B5BDL5_9BACT|nr:methyltransferase domain-containing protein [Geobacter pickeringii]AJE02171.1 hypothetical protein GPICK_01175 [Geobacter pickeringii]